MRSNRMEWPPSLLIFACISVFDLIPFGRPFPSHTGAYHDRRLIRSPHFCGMPYRSRLTERPSFPSSSPPTWRAADGEVSTLSESIQSYVALYSENLSNLERLSSGSLSIGRRRERLPPNCLEKDLFFHPVLRCLIDFLRG